MSLLMDALTWLFAGGHWTGSTGILMRIVQHLGVTVGVVAIAGLIALPIGIYIGHTGRFVTLISATFGVARAIPTLGVLTLIGLWLGIGLSAPFLALLILAVPPMLSATYSGIGSASPTTVDAARAIGLTEMQVVREVELPAALPLIIGGLRSTTLQVVATATLAAYTADAGLGRFLYTGLKTRDYGQMIGGAILVVALALILDALWVRASRNPHLNSEGAGNGERPRRFFGRRTTKNESNARTATRSAVKRKRKAATAMLGATALTASACATAATFDPSSQSNGRETIIVGSQDYYSNEIIAEAYAIALEEAGFAVTRELRIGQREVYMPEIQAGAIDVFPEYTGSLLQYLDADATQTSADEVYEALSATLPDGLRVLNAAPAADQDSYVVTTEFANEHSLTSIGDLASVGSVKIGGNSELATRPYGPAGLKSLYGVTATFTPIEDSGGALTLKALRDGDVQLVDIYSADPSLAGSDLTVLEDPKGLFLASHVVPIVSPRIDEAATAVINRVSATLESADLVEMNRQSTEDGAPAATIARSWLEREGLI